MTIGFMRRIDYWFGIPACFFLSIFHAVFKKLARPKQPPAPIRKILFLELSEIGSTILSYPAITKAKELFPESELFFWIFESNQDAVHVLKVIDRKNVLTVRTKNLFISAKDLINNLRRIRREKIDVVLDLELFSRFSCVLSFLSGAPRRVGFHSFAQEGLYRGNLHTHRVSYNPYQHISVNFLSLVSGINAPLDQVPLVKEYYEKKGCDILLPKLKSTGDGKKAIWKKLKQIAPDIDEKKTIVVIHPGIKEALPLRQWALGHYLELTRRLLLNPNVFIVMAGVLYESLDKDIVEQLRMPRLINLIGKTSIPELIDLFNVSDMLISHDGGIIHIASLTPVHIIALFGPETPSLYQPLTDNKTILYRPLSCSPCLTAYNHRISMCRDNQCVREITVEEVLEKALCSLPDA